MSLAVQIEIMQTPLIDSLEDQAHVSRFRDIHRLPGGRKPKDKFSASDLVLATQAFVTNNSQVTATNEAERFLTEDQRYLDNVGDINDVVTTLKLLAGEIHPKLALMYDGEQGQALHPIWRRHFLDRPSCGLWLCPQPYGHESTRKRP